MTAGRAFTGRSDGDARSDAAVRARVAGELGISPVWATVNQVHGPRVIPVDGPGPAGEGDALVTRVPGLPLAVFTADCLGIVLHGPGVVAVVHAGWRGLAAGVCAAAAGAVGRPFTAAVGPFIGPCCFAVGPDVARRFPGFVAATRDGSPSIDLAAVAESQLGVPLERVGACTVCAPGSFSHRGRRDTGRMAALGWLP